MGLVKGVALPCCSSSLVIWGYLPSPELYLLRGLPNRERGRGAVGGHSLLVPRWALPARPSAQSFGLSVRGSVGQSLAAPSPGLVDWEGAEPGRPGLDSSPGLRSTGQGPASWRGRGGARRDETRLREAPTGSWGGDPPAPESAVAPPGNPPGPRKKCHPELPEYCGTAILGIDPNERT